jgi:hypothetical protein
VSIAHIIKQLTARGKLAARRAAKRIETRILVAQGRKAVRGKVRAVGTVSRKAAKTGLVTGAIAATTVMVREIRKRRGV